MWKKTLYVQKVSVLTVVILTKQVEIASIQRRIHKWQLMLHHERFGCTLLKSVPENVKILFVSLSFNQFLFILSQVYALSWCSSCPSLQWCSREAWSFHLASQFDPMQPKEQPKLSHSNNLNLWLFWLLLEARLLSACKSLGDPALWELGLSYWKLQSQLVAVTPLDLEQNGKLKISSWAKWENNSKVFIYTHNSEWSVL